MPELIVLYVNMIGTTIVRPCVCKHSFVETIGVRRNGLRYDGRTLNPRSGDQSIVEEATSECSGKPVQVLAGLNILVSGTMSHILTLTLTKSRLRCAFNTLSPAQLR